MLVVFSTCLVVIILAWKAPKLIEILTKYQLEMRKLEQKTQTQKVQAERKVNTALTKAAKVEGSKK